MTLRPCLSSQKREHEMCNANISSALFVLRRAKIKMSSCAASFAELQTQIVSFPSTVCRWGHLSANAIKGIVYYLLSLLYKMSAFKPDSHLLRHEAKIPHPLLLTSAMDCLIGDRFVVGNVVEKNTCPLQMTPQNYFQANAPTSTS